VYLERESVCMCDVCVKEGERQRKCMYEREGDRRIERERRERRQREKRERRERGRERREREGERGEERESSIVQCL
jgi:hypothetical protein